MNEATRTCARCSGPIIGRRGHARYCSKGCQQGAWEDRTLRPKPGRTCRSCSESIDHLTGNAAYCSVRCRSWWHGKPANRNQRIPDPIATCPECGERYARRWEAAYCSKTCYKRAYDRAHGSRVGEIAQCPGCSSPFRMKKGSQRYCTGRCRSLAHYLSNADRYKSSATRRKAAMRGVADPDLIQRVEVFERDGWICYLCSEGVDRSLAWPDPRSASLDHVQPLSRGGQHRLENVKLAHLRCNLMKHDRLIDELPAA